MATEDLIAKAVGRIPPQLRREEFRFVPILRGDKRPFEGNWNKPGGNNYSFNDPKLALVSRLQEIIDSDSRAVLWGGRGPTGEAPGDTGGLRVINARVLFRMRGDSFF